MRIATFLTKILVFFAQFLLLAWIMAMSGLYRPTPSTNMANDKQFLVKPNSEKLAADLEKSIVNKDDLPPPVARKPVGLPPIPASPRSPISSTRTDIVIGIPSIKRPEGKLYLHETLKYLIERKGQVQRAIFLVYLAEEDVQWTDLMTKLIKDRFPDDVSKNMIQIITPPPNLYPDWEKDMKLTLGDPADQVKWRSKQNLDAAYLMEYAYSLNTRYYLGIEDDVEAVENYLEKIVEHADKGWNDKIIFASYCPLGAIGKLFRGNDILTVATYLKTFWNYKPIDWLYYDLQSLAACGYPRHNCESKARTVVLGYHTPLFYHKGKISSLDRKNKP